MCGICGFVNLDKHKPAEQEILRRMHKTQLHRGPDDAGFYVNGPVALASQRLAILDLSEHGHMPMVSEDGRYKIIHNGEVYNFQELRNDLEKKGFRFFSNSDTEVVLKYFMLEGPAMLNRCNGMFAFAIWDEHEKSLFAARDRHGVKPFHYTIHEGAFYFASEQKAIFAAGISAQFDESVWGELLMFRYVAGERTAFTGVKRLLPGHYITIKGGGVSIKQWWSPTSIVQKEPTPMGSCSGIKMFHDMFGNSIALRRISDVPIGALLSGGLDSSAMAAMMAKQAGKDVASFTVRFADKKYDEGEFARAVAKRWNLDYHELFVLPKDIPSLFEEATRFRDEPIVHDNGLHLLAISRYAKPKVTVLLSGEGADEILGGYVRYRLFRYAWAFGILGKMLQVVPSFLDSNGRLRKSARLLNTGKNTQRILFSSAEILPFELPHLEQCGSLEYRMQAVEEAQRVYADPVRQVMCYEQQTYLQSVLDRNDRMTMGASIECREPFLDYRMVEWVANLPTETLFRGGLGKHVLRESMKKYLPTEVVNHPKWGFAIPLAKYFRDIPSLRSYVARLPDSEVMRSAPFKKEQLKCYTSQFLGGNDSLMPLIRQLAATSVWYDVCVLRLRNVFQ